MRHFTRTIRTALFISAVGLTGTSSAFAANCTTGAKAAADIWNKYDEIAIKVGCAVGAGAATAATAGAGLPAAAAGYAKCLNDASKANNITQKMVKGWNDLNQNGWGTIGPRKLLVGEDYEGHVFSQTTKMYITPAPVTSDYLNLRIVKRDLRANRGQAEITVCRFPPAGPGTEVTGEKLWTIPVSSGNANKGKLWSHTLSGVRGHIVTVAFKSQSATKSFKYFLTSKPVKADESVVIAGSEGSGKTSYRIDVEGRGIEQVSGTLDGYEVSVDPQDSVSGQSAKGTVGTGNDGFRVVGEVKDISLSNPEAAKVFVNGSTWSNAPTDHTVVIDGTDTQGETDYTIVSENGIDQVEGRLAGYDVSIQDNDTVNGNRAKGHVGDGADGFRIEGDIQEITTANPGAARVYVDGRPYQPKAGAEHAVVIDGSQAQGETDYRIIAGSGIDQVEGRLAGYEVSIQDGDTVSGNRASGHVGDGLDGFRVQGGIKLIELDNPDAAAVEVRTLE